jgi:hypothetical protein
LELIVEEPSMEALLRALLPRLLPIGKTFEVHAFQGKTDLLGKLQARLNGYARWLPKEWRVVIVVDRDDDDCRELKQTLEAMAERAGLLSRSRAGEKSWQLVNRIAVEELEAWYFGDWQAVQAAYPKVSASIPKRQGFRDPDAIRGGTWESFERVLKNHGYFKTGLPKIDVARSIGAHMFADRSSSASFKAFSAAIMEAVE